MTIISGTASPAVPAKTSSSSSVKTNLDYNSFLRLFMAQMKNQDPTKPNDPTETLSQLASFSNVEQSIKFNDKLDTLISTSNATMASALIGKKVSSLDGKAAGLVAGVETGTSGTRATLSNGQTLDLSSGYKVVA